MFLLLPEYLVSILPKSRYLDGLLFCALLGMVLKLQCFKLITSFAYIIQESRGVVKHRVNVVILQGRSLMAGGCVRAESVSLVNYLHRCSRKGEQCSPTKRKSLILSFVPHKKGCSL